MLLQYLQRLFQVLEVLFARAGEDEDVVQIYQQKAPHLVLEDVVHDLLECCWSVGEFETHNFELEVADGCLKRCFGDILRRYADLVVPLRQIQGCEVFGAS